MVVYEILGKKRRNLFFSIIENFSLTTKLIIVNVFLFILFYLLISLKVLSIDAIALNPNNFIHGKYLWTIITSMFMHGGIFHLFVNMLSLYFVGTLIEKILGRRRYLAFYLVSGIFAGLFFVLSAYFIPAGLNSFAVGASGAIFGLIGVLIFLTPNLPVYVMFIPIPVKMKYAAPGMLILLWAVSIAGNLPIGNFAHLGGFISGVVYGLYLRKKFPNKIKYISRQFS